MDDILKFDTINQYNTFNKHESLHPLVSVIDLSKADPRETRRMCYGFYIIFLKQIKCGDLRYGLNNYDYEEGTLVFLAPGQVIGENVPGNYYQPQGRALVFDANLIHGTSLGRRIGEYNFFSYEVSEALHLSNKERELILDCFAKIEYELQNGVDKHSKKLIAANIELFLDYCIRFYDRQFITREVVNVGVIERNYFGDLEKKETGKTALEYILLKIMDLAKEKVYDPNKTVNEIAYELGFKYAQHFSRLFKRRTGYTPNEYRNLN